MVSFILSGEAMGEAMGSNSILVKKCEFFVSFFFVSKNLSFNHTIQLH